MTARERQWENKGNWLSRRISVSWPPARFIIFGPWKKRRKVWIQLGHWIKCLLFITSWHFIGKKAAKLFPYFLKHVNFQWNVLFEREKLFLCPPLKSLCELIFWEISTIKQKSICFPVFQIDWIKRRKQSGINRLKTCRL